jgi:hypothetical protein
VDVVVASSVLLDGTGNDRTTSTAFVLAFSWVAL